MTLSNGTRRILAGLAGGGLLTLVTALPAAAIPDPGSPAAVGGEPTTVVREVQIPADDDALELLQVGLGALGGVVVAAAGAAMLGARRQRDDLEPA